jgi:hypothetical protein
MVLHCRRHPGEETVGDDVVERLPLRREGHEILMPDLGIAQFQRIGQGRTAQGLGAGQFQPHTVGLGQMPGDRQEVAPGGTAQFQHPGA